MKKGGLALTVLALGMALCANSGPDRSEARDILAEQAEAPATSLPGAGSPEIAAPAAASPLPLAQDPALQSLTEEERNTIEIVRRTKNSVVFITNIARVRDFFSFSTQEVPQGSGSGFVWDDEGHIVTNNHVVEGGVRFIVSLPNQEEKEAKLLGGERYKDIAVLELEDRVTGLAPVPLGSSKDLLVGQKAIAIGNPFGFDHTVTTGIVSALGRSIPGNDGITIRDMIQTDASINPGNSGGPLLNSRGELIGMNTVIIGPSGTSIGIGFAVPVDTIRKIVPQIIEYGKVIRPGIGITPLSDEQVRRAGVKVEGAVIREVSEDSPAYAKGLRGLARDQRGRLYIQDVIVAIDDTKIRSFDDLYNALDNYRIGDTVTLTVERNGRTRKVELTLVRID